MKKALPLSRLRCLSNDCFLVIELPKGTELRASIQLRQEVRDYVEDWNKYAFGPFLPGECDVVYEMAHPKFGIKEAKETVDLNSEDQRLTVKEK